MHLCKFRAPSKKKRKTAPAEEPEVPEKKGIKKRKTTPVKEPEVPEGKEKKKGNTTPVEEPEEKKKKKRKSTLVEEPKMPEEMEKKKRKTAPGERPEKNKRTTTPGQEPKKKEEKRKKNTTSGEEPEVPEEKEKKKRKTTPVEKPEVPEEKEKRTRKTTPVEEPEKREKKNRKTTSPEEPEAPEENEKKKRGRKSEREASSDMVPSSINSTKMSKSVSSPDSKGLQTVSLDSDKKLFKDIKDRKTKPRIIIKTKGIAKKVGQVKRDTKAVVEGKAQEKSNHSGRISRKESTKLKTLIAKAKKSRFDMLPQSDVDDGPKINFLQFWDNDSNDHSSRESNSPTEKRENFDKQSERWQMRNDENRGDKSDLKEDFSQSAKENKHENVNQGCSVDVIGKLSPPSNPRGFIFQQEKATPTLCAWLRGQYGPKVGSSQLKRTRHQFDEDDCPDDDSDYCEEDIDMFLNDDEQISADD